MKRRTVLLSMTVGAFLTCLVSGFGADTKIGLVSMERLIRSHPGTRARVAALEAEIKEFEAEHEDMLAERESLKEDFEVARDETRNKALSETAKEEKLGEAEERLIELRQYEGQIGQTAARRKRQVSEKKLLIQRQVIGELRRVIKTYAEKKKLSTVFDSSNLGLGGVPMLMYASESIDITDDIMELIGGVEIDEVD